MKKLIWVLVTIVLVGLWIGFWPSKDSTPYKPNKPNWEEIEKKRSERAHKEKIEGWKKQGLEDIEQRKYEVELQAARENHEKAKVQQERESAKKLYAVCWMNEALQKGIFTHVSENSHQVRMNPLVWLGIPLEAKQGLVAGCSTYFEALTGLPGATILSNQNDTKLGETGWLGGIKIYY
jgi:hypothetical protein